MERSRAASSPTLVTRGLFVLVLWASGGLALAGGIYQWVDAEGRTHFGDRPPPAVASEPVEVQPNVLDAVPAGPLPTKPPVTKAAASSRKVVIFTTPGCGYCRQAKSYFAEQGIDYTEHDIERSSAARREFERLGGTGVPFILVGDRKLAGFSRSSFERIWRTY